MRSDQAGQQRHDAGGRDLVTAASALAYPSGGDQLSQMMVQLPGRSERLHLREVGCGVGAQQDVPQQLEAYRMAQRAEHTRVLPLCPRHHRACYPTGFHAATRSWQQEHGSEEALLEQVAREVTELRKNTIGRAA